MDFPQTLSFRRRNLPHWLVADGTYFVTFRLAGTLPRKLVREIRAEREKLRGLSEKEAEYQRIIRENFIRIESVLDENATGWQLLNEPDVAEVIMKSLPWLEEESRGWNLYAVAIMGSHLHMVLRNEAGRSVNLIDDLTQFKRHTARCINRQRQRTGQLWASENFDHWCRNEEKVIGAVRYTANNPVKARLCKSWRQWPWTKVKDEWIERAGYEQRGSRGEAAGYGITRCTGESTAGCANLLPGVWPSWTHPAA